MANPQSELHIKFKGKTYRLAVEQRRDSGNLIVFIHGWGGSKESFAEAFLAEALKGYGLCTLDLVGFGKSEKPEEFSYDLLDQAHIVALAINSLKAKKVYLVGHSMGGGIGVLAAPLVKNLAIFIDADSNLAPNGSPVNARIAAKQPFWFFRSFTLPLIKALLRLHPNYRMRPWAQWFDEAAPVALYRSVQSLVEWSDSAKLLPLFESLPHKTYIYGENGTRKKDVVPKLSRAITYEIPASGHALMQDNPDDFYATVAMIIRAA